MREQRALEVLERVIRNKRIDNIDLCKVPTPYGMVYIGLGRGVSDDPDMGFMSWQGCYAVGYGGGHFLGRDGEVSGNATKKEALQHFLGDAMNIQAMMAYRDMHDESFRLSNG